MTKASQYERLLILGDRLTRAQNQEAKRREVYRAFPTEGNQSGWMEARNRVTELQKGYDRAALHCKNSED
jgi:hypothetical protein